MAEQSLKNLETHFQFGENWASFAHLVKEERVTSATASLKALVGDRLAGKSFLDIGCGSGLSSVVAARLGVSRILATDIDPVSVRTTGELLKRFDVAVPYQARTVSVFDLNGETDGRFDVVHSWGVLHHTGAMWPAIRKAAELVAPGGYFVLAIYLKTQLCGFWTAEKRVYTAAPRFVRLMMVTLFRTAFYAAMLVRGQNPWKHAARYQESRGMDLEHDFRDWLGGYPYESATPDEIRKFMKDLGFLLEVSQNDVAGSGIFGTCCAEYVFWREG